MGQYLFGVSHRIINKSSKWEQIVDDKSYALTTQDKHGVLVDGYIRNSPPVECERLQTLPDGYTEGITEPNRYKCLGNGWTVDVIAHILSYHHCRRKEKGGNEWNNTAMPH